MDDGVVNDSGEAIFTVHFKALVCRPLKNEVIDGIVTSVDRIGISLSVGSINCFVPHTQIPMEMKFSEEHNKFISEEDPSLEIKPNTILRFKVMSVNVKGQEGNSIMQVIGTIAEDYLGVY